MKKSNGHKPLDDWDQELKSSPKIRYGSGNKRKPFVKSTDKEVESRVSYVEDLLRRYPIRRRKVIAIIRKKFNVEFRMALHYMARARVGFLARLNQTKNEHRADALTFYEGIIASPDNTPEQKMRAQENIDKLLGLPLSAEPFKMQLDHSGELVTSRTQVDVSVLPLDVPTKRKLLQLARSHATSDRLTPAP